jgi:transposase-like protein
MIKGLETIDLEVKESYSERNEIKLRDHLEKSRWPNGIECPYCRSDDIMKIKVKSKIKESKARDGLLQCRKCRKQFTVTVGTLYERSHLPLWKWYYAIYLMKQSKAISALNLKKELQVSYKTAWQMGHKIRKAMQLNVETRKSTDKNVTQESPYIDANGEIETDVYMPQKGMAAALLFKKTITVPHHHVSPKHLDSYINEFEFKFKRENNNNYRNLVPFANDSNSVRAIIDSMLNSSPFKFKDLISKTCSLPQYPENHPKMSLMTEYLKIKEIFLGIRIGARKPSIPSLPFLRWPFLISGKEVPSYMSLIEKCVPKMLPEHIRADVCQDLVVAILSGEIEEQQIPFVVRSFINKVYSYNPWGHQSLYRPISGTGNLTLADTIVGVDGRYVVFGGELAPEY